MAKPTPTPTIAPMTIWITKSGASWRGEADGLSIRNSIAPTRKIAIGSFEPDSVSISAGTSPCRSRPDERSTAKTAAASVEAITAPNKAPCSGPKPNMKIAESATIPALIRTPMVARSKAGAAIRRTSRQSVPMPPEKRMNKRQAMPIPWVSSKFSK